MLSSGVAQSSTSFGWGTGGNVTSAGWQVTLCDPMWHVSSRSGVATLRTAVHLLFSCYSLMYYTTRSHQSRHMRITRTSRRPYPVHWRDGRMLSIGTRERWLIGLRRFDWLFFGDVIAHRACNNETLLSASAAAAAAASDWRNKNERPTIAISHRLRHSRSTQPAILHGGQSSLESPRVGSGHCRITPPRFLAECCKRQLNQGSFVSLYFRLFTFSDLYWVFICIFLYCLVCQYQSSDWL